MCKITEATVVMFLATVYLRLSLSYDDGEISRGLGLRMADTRAKRRVNGFGEIPGSGTDSIHIRTRCSVEI